MENVFANRIESLRTMMRSRGWDAVIITGSDPHGSEYPALRWKQVEWLTGFTGEAGDVVITLDHAGLWTDTRYFIQANIQLEGTGVELHKTRIPEQVLIPEWLKLNFDGFSFIAVDGLCQEACAVLELCDNFEVVSVPNLLDTIWTDRPGIPQTPIYEIDGGETRLEKIGWLRDALKSKGYNSMLVSSLDQIAWLLNVRASDIDYNPYVISYLYVDNRHIKWYVTKGLVEDPYTEICFDSLTDDGVELLPYDDAAQVFSDIQGPLLLDSSSLNYHFFTLAKGECDFNLDKSPVPLRKAVKTAFEIDGMRRAHIIDGVAMERFLYWLEKSLDADREVSEWDAAKKLGALRAECADYMGDSFETISAYGPGAALPHYITPRQNTPLIKPQGLYLVDSGGHYRYGTTDITRTIPVGDCSELEKEDYTLDLKAHIGLSSAIFPAGTAGCQLDALARGPLWRQGRNFGHGTGHGVGFFSGVHEGPQDVRQNFNPQPLLPGMVISDEPGIYREGQHGVRHENIILVVSAAENEFGKWYSFEPLTMCHFDTSALEMSLLTKEEIDWINDYNRTVYRTLAPLLPADVAQWLEIKTAAI